MKILFICAGNVARSQIAEAIFNDSSQEKNIAISAGTKVVRKGSNKEGQKIIEKDLNVIKVMKEIGIDVSNNTRNQLTLEMFTEAERVVVMMPSENLPEYLKPSDKVVFWEVPDPYNQSFEFMRQVRDQIQSMVNNLI